MTGNGQSGTYGSGNPAPMEQTEPSPARLHLSISTKEQITSVEVASNG